MLWGNTGWLKQCQQEEMELDWNIVEELFEQLSYNASFILTGGEPFMYSHFTRLIQKLKERKTFAIICTNGTYIDRHEEALTNNPYPTLGNRGR